MFVIFFNFECQVFEMTQGDEQSRCLILLSLCTFCFCRYIVRWWKISAWVQIWLQVSLWVTWGIKGIDVLFLFLFSAFKAQRPVGCNMEYIPANVCANKQAYIYMTFRNWCWKIIRLPSPSRNYSGIPISWTLCFPNLLISRTKPCFPWICLTQAL